MKQNKKEKLAIDAINKMYGQFLGENAFKKTLELSSIDPEWYNKFEWTLEDEEEFNQWFIKEFKKRIVKSEKMAMYACSFFKLQYSPKTKRDDIN